MNIPASPEPEMNGERTADSGLDKRSGRSQRTGSRMKAVSRFLSAHQYLVLFILTVLIYNLNFRTINSADTLGASLLPFVILDTHVPWVSAASPLIQPENIVSFIPSGNLLYPAYPIVTPVLVTPLYIIPYIIMKVLQIPLDMTNGTCFLIVYAMEKVAASIVTAAAVVAFYAGMRKVVQKEIAAVTALILAFGTSMWSINSQALWQHGMIALLFSVLFWLIVRAEERNDFRIPIALGVCSALLVFTRPADSFLVLPAFVYAIMRGRTFIAQYMGSGILAALPFIAYNETVAGSLFGGYGSLLSEFSFSLQAISQHMAGVLGSPSRGILIFTPVVLLAIPGILLLWSRNISPGLRSVLYCCGIAFLLEVFVYSAFNCWWAGTTYGPRFLAGSLPAVFILVGIALDGIIGTVREERTARPRRVVVLLLVLGLLIGWSVFVQVVGAFYYPNGNWNDSPATFTAEKSFAKADTTRLWDVKDNQISRTFLAGPILVNPIAIIGNLKRTGDIIDPSTDFAIGIGTNFEKGWSGIRYSNGTPYRNVSDGAVLLVQYMRYSLGDNNCTITVSAAATGTPKTLEISVNGEPTGTVTLARPGYTEFSVPATLRSSLRLGTNVIRFRVPDCGQSECQSSLENACISVRNIRITKNP